MLKKFNFFLIIFSDKILSLFLLIIFSPFLFIIYFLLFIFNSGSVFYISERIGFQNKPFKLIASLIDIKYLVALRSVIVKGLLYKI